MEVLFVLALGLVGISGLVEIAPLFALQSSRAQPPQSGLLSPLELLGRQIYIREGCFNCHSQTVRPAPKKAERYGHFSLDGDDSEPEQAFQWGSRRTGPDLANLGGRYSDVWHVAHLTDPRALIPDSTMPAYAYLTAPLDQSALEDDLKAYSTIGIPYSDEHIANARQDLATQANPHGDLADVSALKTRYGAHTKARDFDGNPAAITEMDALVAYLQTLETPTDTVGSDTSISSDQH